MFDFDSLREILATISKNKLRTGLTGLAVAWGIFMLIILLAVGNGFRNGVTANFSDRAKNSVMLWPGTTSKPHNGLPTNRRVRFDEKDYNLLKTRVPEVEYLSALITQSATISYEKEYGAWDLDGVSQDAGHINSLKVSAEDGRFLNDLDIINRRKVVVISPDMKKVLFKNENPLGKYIIASGVAYKVIGVYSSDNQFNNDLPAYIPFTTAQMLYNKGYGFHQLSFIVKGLNTIEANEAFVLRLREQMGALHNFDPTDRSALYVWNTAENAVEAESIGRIIGIFILIIGAASLVAGIVGVGNIMLITVKERTREIGIRKAIGASPNSILRLIIFEAILITAVAGYVGMILGVGLTEIVDGLLVGWTAESQDPMPFKDFTVDFNTVISSTVVLIVCGVGAGLMPAIRATRISPIEAMREE